MSKGEIVTLGRLGIMQDIALVIIAIVEINDVEERHGGW